MFETLRYVDGEPVTNRCRYWAYRGLNRMEKEASEELFKKVSRKTLWNFVSGGRSLTMEKLGYLSDALDMPVRHFFEDIPDYRNQGRAISAKTDWR